MWVAAAGAGGLAAGWAGAKVADRFAPSRSDRPARWRMPVQALVTAGACAAVAARFDPGWGAGPPLVAAVTLIALSAVDLRTFRLPDALTFPALAASLAAVGAHAVAAGRISILTVSAATGIGYGAVLWMAHLLRPAALGFGDVKLALLLGAHLGWVCAAHHRGWDAVALTAHALLIGCLLGAGLALAAALLRRRGVAVLPDPGRAEPDARPRLRDTTIPFGPALASGTLIAVAFSDVLL